jgi:hypothetical protein
MPYKDPERKKEWERLHRSKRLDRRRESRRIKAAQSPVTRPQITEGELAGVSFLVPVAAGAALSAFDPMLGTVAGGLTLFISVIWKKDWKWWVVGIVTLIVVLLSYLDKPNEKELGSGKEE